MVKASFSDNYKREAVVQITERGGSGGAGRDASRS